MSIFPPKFAYLYALYCIFFEQFLQGLKAKKKGFFKPFFVLFLALQILPIFANFI